MTAPDLLPSDFASFFEAVHGVPPFPWQDRLLHRLAKTAEWPGVLDLPTGSGKTAALDIAVFHLAMEADKGADRRAPVRVAFVVDRRLIVDDAYLRAKKIENALAAAARSESVPAIVRRVALRLGHLAERAERPLLARRLRGGVPREDDWARTPSQPTILCSTVDQVGSRLLFRGYGVSDSMKPVHAGLLGSDSLILLDEAHLSEPFRQTLAAVARLRCPAERPRPQSDRQLPQPAPFHTAFLTATPSSPDEVQFKLCQSDYDDPILAKRLAASKPARLIEIPGRQGVPVETQRIEHIAQRATATLQELRGRIANPALGVVVNRVARARAVFEQVRQQLTVDLPGAGVILVIGPARQADREVLIDELTPIRTGTGALRLLARPLVIVATQTIEAGVDIDLDGLVTEAAALDALRQRFGRLNRAGRAIEPVAAILCHRDDFGAKADDPIYGGRLAATWKALVEAAGSPDGIVDFGIAEFPEQLRERAANLVSPKLDAPILMPAYVDLWSQTSPVPAADPEIGLFLHGPQRSPANVRIVWRADIEEPDLNGGRRDHDARERLLELLAAMPPKSGEAVEVPLAAACRWLRAVGTERIDTGADFADAPERDAEEDRTTGGAPAFRWAGADSDASIVVHANRIRPNDLIIVPADYGGCDGFGWNPASEHPVEDVADAAARPFAARRFALRLTPALIEASVPARPQHDDETADPEREGVLRFKSAFLDLMAELRDKPRGTTAAKDLVSALIHVEPPLRLLDLLAPLGALPARGRPRPQLILPYGDDEEGRPRGVVLLAAKGIAQPGGGPDGALEGGTPATEDDWLGSTPGYTQTLEEHSCWVRDRAIGFARNSGVQPEIADDVALAAYLHDAGKADPRFQRMLYGGDWFAVDDTKILAKSEKQGSRAAWTTAGLPDKWRHEALSVRIAREHARFRAAHDAELVLWLIGVHHGYGRPLFPHADCRDERDRADLVNIDGSAAPLKRGAGPQSLAFCFDGWDWAQIFERLKRRYGVWELARMEAIVRLADHRASEAAAQRAGEDAS